MSTRSHRFWVWSSYATEPGLAFVTEFGGLTAEAAQRIWRGEKLARAPRIVVKAYEPGRFVDQLGDYMDLHLVAPVLSRVLEETPGAHLQLLPVKVAGKPDHEYAAVNVLDTVPALDIERSKLAWLPGSDVIERIERFVPRDIVADAPPIFHVAEHPVIVLVIDDLRQRLQAASRHPGVLTPAEEWRNEY